MRTLLIVISMLALASCSSIKPIHRPIKDSGSNGVDLELEKNPRKKIEDEKVSIEIKKPEESIRIGEKGGEVYTENNLPTDESRKVDKKNLKIGLNLGPGLYRTVNYISILKQLEKNNLAPVVVTGTEMGAVIAGLYAQGMTPEMIEWMFFKYFKEKKNYKLYSADWIEEVDEYFLQKIKSAKLEDARFKLIITLFDHNTKKTYFFDKGNIRDLVLLNLRMLNNPLRYKTGQAYSGAFEVETFNARLLQGQGGEFNIALDALGTKFTVDKNNDFVLPVFSKMASRAYKEKKQFDYVVNLPDQKMKLDDGTDAINFMQQTSDYMNAQINQIKKRIQVKLDFINNQLNKETR